MSVVHRGESRPNRFHAMNGRWKLVGVVMATIAASLTTQTASAASTVPPVRVTLHRLASSDGRYEASNRPEWVADTGDRLITVTNSDGLDVQSGSRVDMPSSSVVRASSLDPSSLQRGVTVPGVRKQGVLPTRRLPSFRCNGPVQRGSRPTERTLMRSSPSWCRGGTQCRHGRRRWPSR